ncbi:MAG: hypothetical protein SNJ59_16295 [Aggregatilineales bacterium]
MAPDTTIKIAVLGGSSVGTPELVNALRRLGTPRRPIELVLHGRTPDKLEPVTNAARILAQGCEWLRVRSTTVLEEAAAGAEIILNQVRVGGLAARKFDETFPIQFGVPGEETIGPGGYANALRTVPTVVRIGQELERYAPSALILSFTNPASVIQYALAKTTRLCLIGLCDGPIIMKRWAAAALETEADALVVDYVGMHHYGFITRVFHDGADVTEAMLAGLERVTALDMDVEIVRSLGALPTPYFKYFLHPDRILERQRGKQSRAEQLLAVEAELLAEYAALTGPPSGLAKRSANWYDNIIAPVVMALINGGTHPFILNVSNETAHPWLPADAIIETPCVIEQGVVRPLYMPPPSPELMARIQHNCAYEQLMVEAFLEGSQVKALRALLMNPLVPNAAVARDILHMIWPAAEPREL